MIDGHREKPGLLVPTLCVGTRVPTLCVVALPGACAPVIRQLDSTRDAERGNEIRSTILLLLAALLSICLPIATARAEDDDDDSRPGLVAQYTAGDKIFDRIDRDIQFDWGTHSPDGRLSPGPFSVRWTGKLLIRTEGKHALHLYLQGEATVTLN